MASCQSVQLVQDCTATGAAGSQASGGELKRYVLWRYVLKVTVAQISGERAEEMHGNLRSEEVLGRNVREVGQSEVRE